MGTKPAPWQERGQPSCLKGNIRTWSDVKRCPVTPFQADGPHSDRTAIFTCFAGCALDPTVWSTVFSTAL